MAIVQFIFVDALPNLYESFQSVDMWYSIKGDSKVKSVFIVKKRRKQKKELCNTPCPVCSIRPLL